MRNGQDERKDASICTLEELERVTSEHTLKNTVCLTCTRAQSPLPQPQPVRQLQQELFIHLVFSFLIDLIPAAAVHISACLSFFASRSGACA